MDNPLIVKDAQMLSFQNQWLIARSKATLQIKAQLEKMAIAKKKLVEKIKKACEKFMSRNQSLNMKKLVSKNNANKISTFKNIFSDFLTSDLNKSISLKFLVIARLLTVEKKKTKGQISIFK